MTLLLIHNRIRDIHCILQSLKSNITQIIFDFEKETFVSTVKYFCETLHVDNPELIIVKNDYYSYIFIKLHII